jgi:hypothetical protein
LARPVRLALTPPPQPPAPNAPSNFSARAGVKDGDAKTSATITVRAAQTELQIEEEHIRRQAMPPLQKARKILDTAPARTVHDDHLVRRQIAELQPASPFLFLRLHENKIRTLSSRVHPFVTRASRSACASCVWPYHSAGMSAVKGRVASAARAQSASPLTAPPAPAQPYGLHMRCATKWKKPRSRRGFPVGASF